MERYAIYEGNMERLEKKLARISNKCQKYGCTFHYKQVGEEFRELTDENGHKYTARFVIVEAEGVAKMNGWRFVASVDHLKTGNVINRVDDSVEVPERYYSCGPYCEHCNTMRRRTASYIVLNEETGEFKQVGQNCLRDFTGGLSAEAAARYLSWFEELVNGETPYTGVHYTSYYETKVLLQYFVECVKKFGYVRNTDNGRSTASRGLAYYKLEQMGWAYNREVRDSLNGEMRSVGFNAMTESNREKAEAALEWIANHENNNNYFHNLKTVCAAEYISGRNTGILASLLPTMDRGLEIEAERRRRAEEAEKEAKKSEYVGEIGERITFEVEECFCITSFYTEFGMMYIYKILDKAGNVFIWKTGKCIERDFCRMTGTIKAHNEFRSVKQTELTRCKVA